MEAFKERYNKVAVKSMATALKKYDPKFDERGFVRAATYRLSSLEMKARVVQISEALHTFLPGPFSRNCAIIAKTLQPDDEGLEGFILWPFSHYVETHGLKDLDTSLATLYRITQRFTSEWGIRPFLEKYPAQVYQQFLAWSLDECPHIRRWVSEGTRPNLPWGIKISHMSTSLEQNLSLLDRLKHDPSPYVRTSVANHLNDISWLDPDLVIKTLRQWNLGTTPEGLSLRRRALRNLLKQGHPGALRLLGFSPSARVDVQSLKISRKRIREGDTMDVSMSLTNRGRRAENLMVDYTIGYPKARGKVSKKTFKWKTLKVKPGETAPLIKKVSFKKVTTRKHYPGRHSLEVQVNGKVVGETFFSLVSS